MGERLVIAFGTSGIVLCNHESRHIKVGATATDGNPSGVDVVNIQKTIGNTIGKLEHHRKTHGKMEVYPLVYLVDVYKKLWKDPGTFF